MAKIVPLGSTEGAAAPPLYNPSASSTDGPPHADPETRSGAGATSAASAATNTPAKARRASGGEFPRLIASKTGSTASVVTQDGAGSGKKGKDGGGKGKRNRVNLAAVSPGEARHFARVRRSRIELSICWLLCAAACAYMIYCLAQLVGFGSLIVAQGPTRAHFLGAQLVWNSQPQPSLHEASYRHTLTSPAYLQLIASLCLLMYRAYRIVTRDRDIGYGVWTGRGYGMLALVLLRLGLVAASAATLYAVVLPGLAPTPPVDAVYDAACTLSASFDPDSTTLDIRGNSAQGGCSDGLASVVRLQEDKYEGVVPVNEPLTAVGALPPVVTVGSQRTLFLQPIGTPMGCPAGTPLFLPDATATGQLVSYWLPTARRIPRRCSSVTGYAFSNWYTASDTCNPEAYLVHYNFTRIGSFEHAEQWFCNVNRTSNDTHMTVTYDTVGWLATLAGSSTCVALGDQDAPSPWNATATAVSSTAVGGGFGLPTAVAGRISTASVDSAALGWLTSRHGPDLPDLSEEEYAAAGLALQQECAEMSFGCGVRLYRTNQYLRAVAFHNCTRSFARPTTTAAHAAQQQWQEREFKARYTSLMIAMFIEAGLDIGEGLLFSIIF